MRAAGERNSPHPLPLSQRERGEIVATVPPLLEVRGEIYMTNSDLVLLNQAQQKKGEPPFANTRNVTAGSVRQLDPRVCAERRLRFFCHSAGDTRGLKARSHMEFLDELRGYGLAVTPYVECFPSFAAAVEHCEELIERLHELDFEIDGLVLKVNRFDQRERLGSTSKSPRWVIAYKFEKYEATTRLNDIQVQVGKSGAITPVAILEPVEIAGTTVSQASLHNADEIRKKDVRLGDTVVVEKAGKIIPHIVRVEKHLRKVVLREFTYPTHCPACGEWLITAEGEYPFGTQDWRERILHYLHPFPQKHEGNVRHVGQKLVRTLVSAIPIQSYRDLYRIQQNHLARIETGERQSKKGKKFKVKVGERLASKILRGLERSKNCGLERVLAALAIEGVGPWTATRLAGAYKTIDQLMGASAEQIAAIEGVPPVVAYSVASFLNSRFGRKAIEDLRSCGVNMIATGSTEDRGLVVCRNPGCPAQLKEHIEFFVHRNGMDIEGIGEKLVEQLVNEKVVRTFGDLYRLEQRQDRLLNLARMGRKSVDKLLDGIEASKGRGLARLLNALAIRHVGDRLATLLAERFGSMDALMAASVEQLSETNEIGEKIANSVYDFLHSKFGVETIEDLKSVGVKMKSAARAGGPRALEGKTLVVTGTLQKYSRDEIKELIARHGGHPATGVSKNTDYVVAGEKAGSKLAKAQEFGVPVITEEEFDALIK